MKTVLIVLGVQALLRIAGAVSTRKRRQTGINPGTDGGQAHTIATVHPSEFRIR